MSPCLKSEERRSVLFLVMLHTASKVPPLLLVSVPPDTSGVEVGLHRGVKRVAKLYNNVARIVGLYSLDIIAVRSDLLEHF